MLALFIPQNAAPDIWSWTEFLRTVTGPAIAAVFVIIALYLRDWIEKRNAAQSWYEQYYITEGLDRVIVHFMTIEAVLEDQLYADVLPTLTSLEPLPSEVAARVKVLLQSKMFDLANIWFNKIIQTTMEVREQQGKRLSDLAKQQVTSILAVIRAFNSDLDQLRRDLLDTKVTKKRYVYDIAAKPEVAKLIKLCEQRFMDSIDSTPDILGKQSSIKK